MATRKGNSRDYWADREAQDRQAFGVINGIISREKAVIEREQRIYQAALAELDKELSALEKDVGADAVTQAALQKPMTARELAEWSKRQEERLEKLIAEYGDAEGRKIFGMENAKTGKQDRANRVVRRNETLRKSVNAIANGAAARTETNTREALEREAREGQEAFSAQLPPELRAETRANFNTVDERTVTRIAQTEFKGEDFSERIWADRDVLVDDLNRSVTLAATNGWSIPRLAKEFEHNVAVNERSAERIARTEINRVSNATELAQYRKNKIKYYRFVATEDARTCPICGELHDKVFAVDAAEAGKNFPPVHPNCRCRTVISPVDADGNEDTSWLDDMQAEIDALDDEPEQSKEEKRAQASEAFSDAWNRLGKAKHKLLDFRAELLGRVDKLGMSEVEMKPKSDAASDASAAQSSTQHVITYPDGEYAKVWFEDGTTKDVYDDDFSIDAPFVAVISMRNNALSAWTSLDAPPSVLSQVDGTRIDAQQFKDDQRKRQAQAQAAKDAKRSSASKRFDSAMSALDDIKKKLVALKATLPVI